MSGEIDQAKQGHTLAGHRQWRCSTRRTSQPTRETRCFRPLRTAARSSRTADIYTLMARAIVRGASRSARPPASTGSPCDQDLVIFLDARAEDPGLHRSIGKYGSLDYWESGMDLCLSAGPLRELLPLPGTSSRGEFEWMSSEYTFAVDANRAPETVHEEVQRLVAPLYGRTVRRTATSRPKACRGRSVVFRG